MTMKKKSDILHLVLKGKWYDMIASGEKKEEYRKIKPYWEKRLELKNIKWTDCWGPRFKPFRYVCFHRGYTDRTMTFEIEGIASGYGNPEWGAPTDDMVFIIKWGRRMKKQQIEL